MNGHDLGMISEVLLVLFFLSAFAFWLNAKIESLGTRAEGWTWVFVVAGVFVTLIGIGLMDLLLVWNAFFIGLLAFVFSGMPMIYGNVMRFIEMLERVRKAAKDDAEKTLAK